MPFGFDGSGHAGAYALAEYLQELSPMPFGFDGSGYGRTESKHVFQ